MTPPEWGSLTDAIVFGRTAQPIAQEDQMSRELTAKKSDSHLLLRRVASTAARLLEEN